MAEHLFYKRPTVLDRNEHKKLRFKPADNVSFSQSSLAVPLLAGEFSLASREFPIIFLRSAEGDLTPVALLGLPGDQNQYVDEEGNWLGRYVPAFVRRYPFVLARADDSELVVCFDEEFSGLGEKSGGELLFDKSGEPTETLSRVTQFLTEFHQQSVATQQFVKKLAEADLLTESTATIRAAGHEDYSLQGLLIVDEQKLRGIDDSMALQLFRSAEIGLIYAHLMSLSNLTDLLAKRDPVAAAA